MFYKLLKAYKNHGIDMHIGNSKVMSASMAKNGEMMHAGGGAGITDLAFFFALNKIFKPSRIFCIGNACGYGTLALAEIFDCPIDAVDCETEGEFNKKGSELTRLISKEVYDDKVSLFQGYSPQDLETIIGDKKYDLCFIDGEHTNEQQKLDFDGMQKFMNDSCIFYLHDVEFLKMEEGFMQLETDNKDYNSFSVDFSTFGCKMMIRNLPIVKEWGEFINESPIIEWRNIKSEILETII